MDETVEIQKKEFFQIDGGIDQFGSGGVVPDNGFKGIEVDFPYRIRVGTKAGR